MRWKAGAQYSGNKVRVTAQFIDAETGAHLWADQFDADRSNLLEMQDEIVVRLSRALLFQFVAVDIARGDRTRPSNVDAQDLAMRALRISSKGPQAGPLLLVFAIVRFRSTFATLWRLAFRPSYYLRVIVAQSDDRIAATRRADELVSRALAIDPNDDSLTS